MKKHLLILFLAISVSGFAQKVKLVSGSLAPLKGQQIIKVEFGYDNMVISRDNIPESDYIKRKKLITMRRKLVGATTGRNNGMLIARNVSNQSSESSLKSMRKL